MSCTKNMWLEYVEMFKQMNPELSHKEALQEASESYRKLKNVYKQKGGFNNIDLNNPQLRYQAGISALNSGLTDIGRPIKFD